jgi:hypothetical protein
VEGNRERLLLGAFLAKFVLCARKGLARPKLADIVSDMTFAFDERHVTLRQWEE